MEAQAASAAPYGLDLQIVLTLVVAGTWWALYRPLLAQDHYRWWAWGWTAFLVFLVGARLGFTGDLPPRATLLLHVPAGLLQVTCFTLGAETLRRGEDLDRREQVLWLGAAALVGLLVAVYHFPYDSETVRITTRTLTRSPGLSVALVYCGWQFLDKREAAPGVGVWVTVGGFFLYALDQAIYSAGALHQAVSMMAGVETSGPGIELILSDVFIVADMTWEAAIGVGAVFLLVEEKDRLYRISRRSRRQFQALFEESVDGILVASADGRVKRVNPAAVGMLDYAEHELEGRELTELIVGDDLPLSHREIRDRGGLTLETRCRTGEGAELPVELSLSAYEIDGRRYLQAIMRDISTRKALMERLTHRATHNPLTDLPNRQYVFDELERMLARLRRGDARPAVLFLDLDDFKRVNDTHGHAAGDQLLIDVAARLEETVRATELVGHLGGDEFVVVAPDCAGPGDLGRVAGRVADALSAAYRVEGHDLRLTVSVGGALAEPDDTPDGLVRRADQAMYRAKASGRDRASSVVLDPDGTARR